MSCRRQKDSPLLDLAATLFVGALIAGTTALLVLLVIGVVKTP